MKFSVLIFLSLFLTSNYKPISDLQRMGLKGKVKSFTEVMDYKEHDFTLKETSFFDEKGNLTRRQFYEYHIDFEGNQTEVEGSYESYKVVSPNHTTYSIYDRGRIIKEGELIRLDEFKFLRKENEFGTYQQEIISEYNSKFELIKLHRKAFLGGDSINVKLKYNYKKGKLKSIEGYDLLKNETEILEIKNHQEDDIGNVISAEYHKYGKILYTSTCEIEYYN